MKKTAVDAVKVLESKETGMKKALMGVIALGLLVVTSSALAQHGHRNHGHYNHHKHYRGNNWVAPAIIGGVIGYGFSRNYYEPYYAPPPVYYTPPPVVYSPPQVVQPVNCTRYIYQDQYGNVTREETRCN